MRLWHESLISKLPRQQLLGQHREIAALRGNGWGKKHATVNYVFGYSPYKLYQFHVIVISEMKNRGYIPDTKWLNPLYRGKVCSPYMKLNKISLSKPIYSEHNAEYLENCLENLKNKGVDLKVSLLEE